MLTTSNYALKKPEGTDVVNIDDFNFNADTIDKTLKGLSDGKANTSHNHTLASLSEKSYNSLTDKPTSLLANGGNSDTVGGLPVARTGTGAIWGCIPRIGTDGVTELGKYVDFHESSNDGVDFVNRLQSNGTGQLLLNSKRLLTEDDISNSSLTENSISYVNGFYAISTIKSTYYKTKENVVIIECGCSNRSSHTGNTTLFYLPEGYRPSNGFIQTVGFNGESSPIATVTVNTDGSVTAFCSTYAFYSLRFSLAFVAQQ